MTSNHSSTVFIALYHNFVTDKTQQLSPDYGTIVETFEHQLEFFKKEFEILSYESFLEVLEGERKLDRPGLLITFDDGTIDHYEIAYPLLEKFECSAVFFVGTDSIENRNMMPAHMRHYIVNKIGTHRFRDLFTKNLLDKKFLIENFMKYPEAVVKRSYPNGNLEESNFKFALNFAMPPQIRNQALAELFQEFIGDPKEAGDKLYLKWDQVHEMHEAGFTIGGHSHTHEAMSLFDVGDLEIEIHQCRALLEKYIRFEKVPFAYPYGKEDHLSRKVIEAVEKFGFHTGFLNIPGPNIFPVDNQTGNRFKILRIDGQNIHQFNQEAL